MTLNYDIITACIALSYILIVCFIGFKYEAGLIVKEEFRKDYPANFLGVVIMGLLILIVAILILSLFVDFKGSRILMGFSLVPCFIIYLLFN